jgi:hypothetical protein
MIRPGPEIREGDALDRLIAAMELGRLGGDIRDTAAVREGELPVHHAPRAGLQGSVRLPARRCEVKKQAPQAPIRSGNHQGRVYFAAERTYDDATGERVKEGGRMRALYRAVIRDG